RIAEPAIHYARHGFPVSPTVARLWALGAAKLGDQPGFAECFLPGGRPLAAGEVFRSEGHARTLEAIVASEGEDFYRGALARAMVAHAQAHGGALALEDLDAHRADWVGTVSQRFGDSVVHEIPPNGQGIAALIALGILDQLGLGDRPVDDVDTLHLMIEATKLGMVDADAHVAEESAMRFAPQALLDPAYLAERAALVDRQTAGDPGHGTPRSAGTIYLTTAD